MLHPCLSYGSIAARRHRDQGYVQMKACTWGLAYSFRGRVHDHQGRKLDGRQTEAALGQLRTFSSYPQVIGRDLVGRLVLGSSFETSKPTQ